MSRPGWKFYSYIVVLVMFLALLWLFWFKVTDPAHWQLTTRATVSNIENIDASQLLPELSGPVTAAYVQYMNITKRVVWLGDPHELTPFTACLEMSTYQGTVVIQAIPVSAEECWHEQN